MSDFPAAMPHGELNEVFPNVFVVQGGFRFGPGLSITRNMTVIRQGKELIVANSVRLSEAGEARLARLGEVKHVLRVGAFHGLDDPYYRARFGAAMWAAPGTTHEVGLRYEEELRPDRSPIDGGAVFAFEAGKRPEVALVLGVEGGVLVTCDSYQNWTTFEGCSAAGKVMMRMMGFGPTLIGGPWTKMMGTDVRRDFERLRSVEFRHLIPGHGTVLQGGAKAGLDVAIRGRFGA